MGSLSTHVLDTATGKPAEGMKIELIRITGDTRDTIGSFTTNSDGRVDALLLSGDAFQHGQYELIDLLHNRLFLVQDGNANLGSMDL